MTRQTYVIWKLFQVAVNAIASVLTASTTESRSCLYNNLQDNYLLTIHIMYAFVHASVSFYNIIILTERYSVIAIVFSVVLASSHIYTQDIPKTVAPPEDNLKPCIVS